MWLAIDVKTREIVGVHIGDRSETGAKALWQSLPPIYRQCAVCYTDTKGSLWGSSTEPTASSRWLGKWIDQSD